jgi:hypothetical protein
MNNKERIIRAISYLDGAESWLGKKPRSFRTKTALLYMRNARTLIRGIELHKKIVFSIDKFTDNEKTKGE